MSMKMDLSFVIQNCNDPHKPIPAETDFTEEDYTAAIRLHNYWNDAWEQDQTDPNPDTDDTMSDVQSHSGVDDEISVTYSPGSVDRTNTDKSSAQASTKTKTPNKAESQSKRKAEKATNKTKATSNSKASKQTKSKTATKSNKNKNKNKVTKGGKVEKGTTCTKIRLVLKQSESEGSN